MGHPGKVALSRGSPAATEKATAVSASIETLAPHDLRRTCARPWDQAFAVREDPCGMIDVVPSKAGRPVVTREVVVARVGGGGFV